MSSLEMFLFLLVETDQPVSEDGPSSYDQVAADVAAVRRHYADQGWIEGPGDADDLDELCWAYVDAYVGGWIGC